MPFIVATVWLMLTTVPESRDEDSPKRLDWTGAALVGLGLAGLAYGLIEGPVQGWGAVPVIVALASGAVALIAFPFYERRIDEPMVPLEIFRIRNFTGANLATLGVYFALQGMSFFLVLFMQNVMGWPRLQGWCWRRLRSRSFSYHRASENWPTGTPPGSL